MIISQEDVCSHDGLSLLPTKSCFPLHWEDLAGTDFPVTPQEETHFLKGGMGHFRNKKLPKQPHPSYSLIQCMNAWIFRIPDSSIFSYFGNFGKHFSWKLEAAGTEAGVVWSPGVPSDLSVWWLGSRDRRNGEWLEDDLQQGWSYSCLHGFLWLPSLVPYLFPASASNLKFHPGQSHKVLKSPK